MADVPHLSNDEWTELLERLTRHASRKLPKLYWRGIKAGPVPGGIEPEDLAMEAITDLLKGVRKWDTAKHPQLTAFLMSVIDSKISHLVESSENRRSRDLPVSFAGNGSLIGRSADHGRDDPATVAADGEEARRFQQVVLSAIQDDPMAQALLECLKKGMTKPTEIATALGVDITVINNAQKRLRRKTADVVANWRSSQP